MAKSDAVPSSMGIRASVERAYLARRVADPAVPVLRRVTALLVLHQRMYALGCGCGWNRLGGSHAEHQAEELAKAGLLLSSGSTVETGG